MFQSRDAIREAHKKGTRLFLSFALATACAASLRAATFTWDGGGTNNNWSTANNWNPNGAPANNSTADIVFSGITRLTPNVDTPWSIQSLKFAVIAGGTGSFVLSGSPITIVADDVFDTGIDARSGVLQTINNDITVANHQKWDGDLLCNGSITLNDELTFEFNNFTLTGAITGAGSIVMRANSLTFSGASINTFTGGISVPNGTLILNKSTLNTAIRSNLNIPGGTVRLDADDQISSNAGIVVTLSSDGLLNLNGHNDTIFTLRVNDFSDVTTGAGTLTVVGSIERDDGGGGVPGLISGNLSLGAGTREIRVADTEAGNDLDISAAISNGAVRKTGAGTVIFSGTNANTYTGTTTVEAGTLVLNKGDVNGAILGDLVIGGSGTAATVALAGNNQIAQTAGNTVTLGVNGALQLGDFGDAINDLTLAGGSVTSAAGLLTLGGNLTSSGTNPATALTANLRLGSGPRVFNILAAGGSSDLTLATNITGLNATAGIIKEGPGILLLSGINIFAGGITLNAGTLKLGHNNAAGSGPLVLTAGTLQAETAGRILANAVNLNGNVTFGGSLGLTFNGAAVLTANTTLTVNNTSTFADIVSENAAGRTLTKAGTGTLVLTESNSFTGGFTLSTGTLLLGNDSALGSGAFSLNGGTVEAFATARALANSVSLGGDVAFGGTLPITFNGTGTLTGNRTVTIGSGLTVTFTNSIGQNAAGRSLTKIGAGTLVLGNANTFSGGVTVSAGTLAVGHANAAGTGTLTLNAGATLRADLVPVTLPNAVALAGDFTVGGLINLVLAGAATLNGNRVITVNNVGLTTMSGVIGQSGGTFGITKTGSSTLLFSGAAANTYGGVTNVTGGTLALAKSAPDGAITGSSLVVGDGSGGDLARLDASDQIADATTLTVNLGGTLDLNDNSDRINVVTLQGGTVASGAGIFTLGTSLVTIGSSSAATFSGNLSLNAGTRTVTVADGAATNDLQISASISNGSLTKQGAGLLRIFGSVANTYTGTTTVNDGTLLLAKTGADGAIRGNLTINAGVARLGANEQILATAGNQVLVSQAQFDLAGFAETIQDLVLVGGNVSGGTLTVLGSVSSLSSDLSASISGTVNLGASARAFTVANGTAIDDLAISALLTNGALSKSGPGQLLLSRSAGNSMAGAVSVNGGTLRVENVSGSATGAASVTVNSTGTLAGAGIISSSVTIADGGTIAPGTGAGTLTTGPLSLAANSTARFELSLAGTIGGGVNDLIVVNGAHTLDGTLNVTELPGFGDGVYTLFDYSGALTNSGLALESAFLNAHPGSTIQIDAANTRVNLVVIPEPGTAAILLGGLVSLVALRRERRPRRKAYS